jgi:hypothetical protein
MQMKKSKPGYDFLTAKIAKITREFQLAYDLFTSLSEEVSIKEEVKAAIKPFVS